jgi:hypothetical protein
MSSIRSVIFSLCASFLLFHGDAIGLQESNTPEIYDDPLLWDDFVVKGIVAKIDHVDMTAEDWFSPFVDVPQNHGPVQLIRVFFGNQEILRGFVPQSNFSVVAHRPKRAEDELRLNEELRAGETLFVTGRCRPEKGLYVATTFRVHDSTGWRNVLGERWQDPLSETEIRNRVASVSVANMSRESDLVLRGRVLDHRKVGPEGSQMDEYEVAPDKVLKGTVGPSVIFRAGGGIASDESKWRMLFVELDEGSSWYFFLKRDGSTYVPTAGWRAAFRLDGNKLYERIDIPSNYTPTALERDVVKFASD